MRAAAPAGNQGAPPAGRREPRVGRGRQRRSVGLLTLAVLLALSPWFSAAAVAPQLERAWGLTTSQAAWLTLAVQLGFAAGTLLSGVLNLPDRVDPARLAGVSAAGAALTTALFALLADGPGSGALLRVLSGVCLAGVYPPALKLAATWTRRGRGLALGLVVGALTVGSASPHLLRALVPEAPWRFVVLASAALAAAAALLLLAGLRQGPFRQPPARFDPRFALDVLRRPGTRLAVLGYLGHQWELYGMWAWTPLFTAQAVQRAGGGAALAGGLAFGVIAVGGVGAVAAGVAADRLGRCRVASGALALSGAAALTAAALVDAPLWALVPVLMVWGLSVVADSAQFSAAVSELCPPRYVGTALTMQVSVGFLVTALSIQTLGLLLDGAPNWALAFAALAAGPLVGVAAMLGLRRRPESIRMAGGRR